MSSSTAASPKTILFTAEAQPSHDVILVSSDNVRFHVHKKHLVLFSTVFEDMWKLEEVIDQEPIPIIPLPGDDASVLEDMLPYFYPFTFEATLLHEKKRFDASSTGTTMSRLKAGVEFADKYAMTEHAHARLTSAIGHALTSVAE